MSDEQETPRNNSEQETLCQCILCGLDADLARVVIKVAKVAQGLTFCFKLFRGAAALAATLFGGYAAIDAVVKLIQG